jgi:hypothetical protein
MFGYSSSRYRMRSDSGAVESGSKGGVVGPLLLPELNTDAKVRWYVSEVRISGNAEAHA